MIAFVRPEGFEPLFHVAGCFIEVNGHFLLLQRAPHDSFGGCWGAPGGGIDEGEDPQKTVVREIQEETGIAIHESMVEPVGVGYVTMNDSGKPFVYHMFHIVLDEMPDVFLNPEEHSDFAWVTAEDSLELDLVDDMDECIRKVWLTA